MRTPYDVLPRMYSTKAGRCMVQCPRCHRSFAVQRTGDPFRPRAFSAHYFEAHVREERGR